MNKHKDIKEGWDNLQSLLRKANQESEFKYPLTSTRKTYYQQRRNNQINSFHREARSLYLPETLTDRQNLDAESSRSPISNSPRTARDASPYTHTPNHSFHAKTQRAASSRPSQSRADNQQNTSPRRTTENSRNIPLKGILLDRTRSTTPSKAYYHHHRTNTVIKPGSSVSFEQEMQKGSQTARVSTGNDLSVRYKKSYDGLEQKDFHGFNVDQVKLLFRAKCEDLNLAVNPRTEQKFLAAFLSISTENMLNLNDHGMGLSSSKAISKLLSENYSITHLNLRRNYFRGPALTHLCVFINTYDSLIHLNLSNNSMEARDIEYIFESLKGHISLISIDISNYYNDRRNKINDRAINKISEYLEWNKIALKLKMASLGIGMAHYETLFDGICLSRSLVLLDLEGNDIEIESPGDLVRLIWGACLEEVNLSRNKIGDKAFRGIQKHSKDAPKKKDSSLILNLSQNIIKDGISDFFDFLISDHTIGELNLSGNDFSVCNFGQLKSCLSINDTLESLNLSGCRLGYAGGRVIEHGLAINKTLEKLNISLNDFGDEIGAEILRSLTWNKTLKELNLSANFLKTASGAALVDLITKNRVIVSYIFRNNQIEEDYGHEIFLLLYRCTNILQMDLQYNFLRQTTADGIIKKVQDNLKQREDNKVPVMIQEIRFKREVYNDSDELLTQIQRNETIQQKLVEEINHKKECLKDHLRELEPEDLRLIEEEKALKEKSAVLVQEVEKFERGRKHWIDAARYEIRSLRQEHKKTIEECIELEAKISKTEYRKNVHYTENQELINEMKKDLQKLAQSYHSMASHVKSRKSDIQTILKKLGGRSPRSPKRTMTRSPSPTKSLTNPNPESLQRKNTFFKDSIVFGTLELASRTDAEGPSTIIKSELIPSLILESTGDTKKQRSASSARKRRYQKSGRASSPGSKRSTTPKKD